MFALDAPPLEPMRFATPSQNPLSFERVTSPVLSMRRTRFGSAHEFFANPLSRPASAAAVSDIRTVEELLRASTPALELPVNGPRIVATRPASAALSLGSTIDVSLSRPSRPASALSVTTRDMNETAAVVLSHFSASDHARLREQQRKARALPRSFMTQSDAELEAEALWDVDGVSTANRQSADAEAAERRDVLARARRETWRRLWRTKADAERELLKGIEAAAANLPRNRGVTSKEQKDVSYAAVLGTELEAACLSHLRVTEKLAVLRADTEKRRQFSHACGAMIDYRKAEGLRQVALRRQKSAALLKGAAVMPDNIQSAIERPTPTNDSVRNGLGLGNRFGGQGGSRSAAQTTFRTEDMESLSGDEAAQNERNFFAAASQMTHEMERRRRGHVALERSEVVRCAKVVRAAEDIERIDFLRVKQFEDAQVELRVNWFATATLLAVHLGGWLSKVSRTPALSAEPFVSLSSPTAAGAASPSASSSPTRSYQVIPKLPRMIKGCSALVGRRSDAELRHAIQRIWAAWLVVRGRVRFRRRNASIAVIKAFCRHRHETMRFVVAVKRFSRIVKNMQSWWRGVRTQRSIRRDLVIRQITSYLQRIIHVTMQMVSDVKEACRKSECEIANRKGVPRLVKGQMIAEVKKDAESQMANLRQRAHNAEVLQANHEQILVIVDRALAKKHHDYSQQVARYAKALSQYDRDVANLRDKGIIIVAKRRKRQARVVAPGTSSEPPSAGQREGKQSSRPQRDLDSARRHTSAAAQLETLQSGGKIFVPEPVSLQQLHGGTGSSSRTGPLPGDKAKAKGDMMIWALLKERGLVYHVPSRPIQPFFHALFHRSEMDLMIDTVES